MPASFQTTLPQEDQPSLGNGVEDEIAVDRETQPTNYGSIRVQIRETSQSSWDASATGYAEQVLNYDTLTTIFQSREDGEEYEVRARTETEHTEGEWTTPTSIIALFPGSTNLQVDGNPSENSVPMAWIDQSDNEDGFIPERRREYASGWGEWQPLDDLPPDTESFTDDTAIPGSTYEYRVRAYTEHTDAVSNTIEVETTGLAVASKRIPASGWYIELEHPNGAILTPRVTSTPEKNPRVNDLPRIRIPVPKDDKWTGLTDQPLRVWHDGTRQPIDELVKVEQTTGETVLIGEGGIELRQDIQRDIVEEEADDFIRGLVQDETGYVANVDDPTESVEPDALVQAADDQESMTTQTDVSIPDDDPRYIEGGNLGAHPSGWLVEAENNRFGADEIGTSEFSNNRGAELNTDGNNPQVRVPFTPEYDFPIEELRAMFRWRIPGDGHPSYEVRVDGGSFNDDPLESVPADIFQADTLEWYTVEDNQGLSGSLTGGTDYLIRFIITGPSEDDVGSSIEIDLANAFDNRHLSESVFEGNVQTSLNEYANPAPIPPEVQFESSTVSVARQVLGARLETTMNSPADTRLELSPDAGATWPISASDSESVSGEYSSVSTSARARFTLNTMHGQEIPLDGWDSREVDAFDVYADLSDQPILVNESYDASMVRVLQEIADQTNSVWWLLPTDGGGISVEWTQPGMRPLDQSLTDLVDYSYSEDTSKQVEEARVFGSNREYSEEITASHDTEVELSHSPLVNATERVRDPDSGVVYEYESDYIARGNASTIEALSTGDISDGQTLEVTYEYTLNNSYSAPGVGNPRSRRFDININTTQGCGQAALYLVKELQDPVVEADVVIPKSLIGWDVGRALSAPELPGSDHQIRELEDSPESVDARLANRENVQEAVDQLRGQIEGNTQRV